MAGKPIDVLITVALSEEQIEPIRQISPRLRIHHHPVKSAEDIPADIWEQVEILYTDRVLPSAESAPNLKWVQVHFAGIDHLASHPLIQVERITFTTMSGAVAPQVAEHVLMMLLALGHKLPEMHALQAKAEWPRDRWERLKPLELRNSTVGLVGYGSIGREIARLLQPLNAHILAAKRDAMHPAETDYAIEGLGDPQGDLFTRLYPTEAVRSMIKECDFVVICVPLTPATRGMIGEAELAAMKPGAYLVDVSRGGIVNHAALVEALQEKKIGGAALDVFPEEPLPPSSPLWKMPNVLISPHVSGISPHYTSRAVALFSENLKRYLQNIPLYNQFDRERGY
jgi:phosphoglycerate dehydrogenase-like enzyme